MASITLKQAAAWCGGSVDEKYADVTFRIAHNRTEQPFEFDLCVSADPLQEENLCAVSLMREELRLAVAVKDPMAQQKNVNFAALKDRRFVLMPEPNSVNRMVNMLGAQNGFTPQIGILCDDPLYVRKYVAMGLGVTLAPMVSWKGLFGTDTVLIPLSDAGQPIYRTTHLFWHEHRSMPQRVKLFRSLIMESFAAESV